MQACEGPLAEFAALRAEIQDRVRAQQQMLSLQLTLTGTVFGFTISRPSMIALLLIVPFSSYLLCARLVAQHFGILIVAKYIREELSGQVPGGLGWEQWLQTRRHARPYYFLGLGLPLLLTFVGSGVLALGWAAGFVLTSHNLTAISRAGLIMVWLAGPTATALSAIMVLQMARQLPYRKWEQGGPS
jgi:hypothetical protein